MNLTHGLVNIENGKAIIFSLGGIQEGKLNEIQSENDNGIHFYKEVVGEIKEFDVLVLAGHGKGSANESRNFMNYLQIHKRNIAKKVTCVLTTDRHETENQLLARADKLVGAKHIGNHNGKITDR